MNNKNVRLRNKFPRFLFVLFAGVLLPSLAWAAIADYAFQKDILTPNVQRTTELRVNLDPTVISKINTKASNISVFDSLNNEVSFDIFHEEAGRIESPEVVAVSSQKKGDVSALIDNDVITTYAFDNAEDGKDASWATIDLGTLRPVNRVYVYPAGSSNISAIEIKAGAQKNKLRTIVSKRPYGHGYQYFVDFTSPPVRYIQVRLWGIKVSVDDIKIIGSTYGDIYFDAEPGKKYRVFYGAPLDLIRYTEKHTEQDASVPEVFLAREEVSGFFIEDYDGDGYNNDIDNCPYVSNPSQSDSDEDSVGNACDNAPKSKNYNQSDIDRDGIGDIIDNCKLDPNPEQENIDNDEYGDACDYSFTEKEISDEQRSKRNLLAALLGILIIAGGSGFAIYRLKKTSKKTKK